MIPAQRQLERYGGSVDVDVDEDNDAVIVSNLNKDKHCRGFNRACLAKSKHADGLCGHCHNRKNTELQKYLTNEKKKREEQLQEAIFAEKLRLEYEEHCAQLNKRWSRFEVRRQQIQQVQLSPPLLVQQQQNAVLAITQEETTSRSHQQPASINYTVPAVIPHVPVTLANAPAVTPPTRSVESVPHAYALNFTKILRSKFPNGVTIEKLRAEPSCPPELSDALLTTMINVAYSPQASAELEQLVAQNAP